MWGEEAFMRKRVSSSSLMYLEKEINKVRKLRIIWFSDSYYVGIKRAFKYRSSVSSELDGVSSSVVGSAGRTGLGVEMSFDSETATGFTSGGDSSQLSVFLVGLGDPADVGVVSDGVVGGINTDDFVVFVGSVLGDPVAVEHSESSQSSADPLLSLGSEVAGGLELVDTDWGGLSSDDTLGDGSLSASSSDSGSVDDVALLGLEAEFTGLVGTGGVVDAGDDGELSVLPGAYSEDEVHEVGLFLPPQLFQIFVGSHVVVNINYKNNQFLGLIIPISKIKQTIF